MTNFAETKAQIIDLVNKQIVPGASFGFITPTETTKCSYGNKSWLPTITPLKGDELHDLASLTKVMGTVPLIIKMLNEKLINLHDPIQKYLPEFTDERVELFHLITHTSGIHGYIPNRDSLNSKELIQALLKLPVTDTFNKKVVYTDTGLIFLGLVIEKFYKMSVQDAIMKYIIEPEGLKDATFNPEVSRCVPTYVVDGKMLVGVANDPKARQLGKHCGSAGMFATLDDVMKFTADMLKTDKEFLYHNITELNPGRSLGWDVKPDGSGHVLFHTGYTGEFIAVDYQQQTAMVVMTNRVHPIQNNQLFLERRETILNSFLNESK
ncbi:serine hydrolase domain-containing protein [Companilactobacillus kimchiensis]|uniref:Beta-lactamase class C related penicillin binding protein n=1 Tax=Companilactobacillus kimchiensis TaxID=993692 RepID=A0A0R2LCX4_9LACO|nr:serine hydrolase domain-containing protein [Companilactobacillus kimchiensis]KRN97686.1 Beta-lactamase class C related penicillin binding protein [Companilactobacillus kimchiensis]